MDSATPERPVSPVLASLEVAGDADLHMDVHMRGLRLDQDDAAKPKATRPASRGASRRNPQNFADLQAAKGRLRPTEGKTPVEQPYRNTSASAPEIPQVDFVSSLQLFSRSKPLSLTRT